MARPTREEMLAILKQQRPALDAVRVPNRPRPKAEAGTVNIAELRKKWIGLDAAEPDPISDEEDLASIVVGATSEGRDQDPEREARTEVFSGRLGRPIGSQG